MILTNNVKSNNMRLEAILNVRYEKGEQVKCDCSLFFIAILLTTSYWIC